MEDSETRLSEPERDDWVIVRLGIEGTIYGPIHGYWISEFFYEPTRT